MNFPVPCSGFMMRRQSPLTLHMTTLKRLLKNSGRLSSNWQRIKEHNSYRSRFARCALLDEQNVAVVTAFVALIAIFPPNCLADVRERGAELTFCVGRRLGCCR